MTEKRINPETGVFEEKHWYGWAPSENTDGREERINADTGVREERRWYGWTASDNSDGREQRVNRESGVHEERRWYGWTPSENAEGREQRANPETGVQEEKRWFGWTSSENSQGREERINPETGVYEEKRWYGWSPNESSERSSRMGTARAPQDQRESCNSSAATASTYSSSAGAASDSSTGSSAGESGGLFGGIAAVAIVGALLVAFFSSNADHTPSAPVIATTPAPSEPTRPVYLFENTLPGTYNMHGDRSTTANDPPATPPSEQYTVSSAQEQATVPSFASPSQFGGSTIRCVLPSGVETPLHRDDCRQRSGVIFSE